MAEALQCQGAFISQVFNSELHFSLEQAERLARFLGLSEEEAHYFYLLIQQERAGTQALQKYFEGQIQKALQQRLILKDRLGVKKTLQLEDQAIYYSSWHYSAIHVALTILALQTKESLARRLGLPLSRVSQVLEFLVSRGLAIQEGSRFRVGESRIHLGNDSPLVNRHHSNWRMKAMEAMETVVTTESSEEKDLHYSSVVTISREDALKIQSKLIQWLSETKAVIRDSKEEDIYSLCFDFFRLKGQRG